MIRISNARCQHLLLSVCMSLCLTVSSCRRDSCLPTNARTLCSSTLQCVVEHGDKPGNIYVLTVSKNQICDGKFFLTDPNNPGDVSHGQELPMQIERRDDTSVTAKISVPPDRLHIVIITMVDPLNLPTIRGLISDDSGLPPEEVVFTRVR
jgi:hypothetical protein